MDKKILEIINKIYLSINENYKKNNINTDELIKKDIDESIKIKTNENIFKRLIFSIHNANWKAISQQTFWNKNLKNYKKVFSNFNIDYSSKLNINKIKNKGLIKSKRKIKTCIDAAKFLKEIKSFSDINVISFFNKFAYNGSSVYERWALVNIISQSIKGIGTALACDFLKEIGYLNYGKPDIHIKRIFNRIGIIDFFENTFIYSDTNFFIFRILDYISNLSGKSLFEIDKIIWLFATGYNNKNNKSIGGICKDEPECKLCKVHLICKYYKNEFGVRYHE